MNKDVIYIDVDDDVTAIIGKIKKAKEKVVALVPPKRVGTLQSAVNLRLLDRMAKADKKHLVLITNNQALVALAANAKIPVAKNLQSKPEIAEVPAIIVDDGDDIINGADLPVGDHAASVAVAAGALAVKDGTRNEEIDATDLNIDGEDVAVDAVAKKTAAKKGKNRPKIPNFDSFRKKLFLIILGAFGLAVLLFWMFVIAPSATVIITASTTPAPVSSTVKLGGTAATDYKAGVVNSVSQTEQKDETIAFDATGQKDVGATATGTVRFSTPFIGSLGTIPAGTKLKTTSGLFFATDEAVTLTASNYTGVNVPMTATAAGANYNGATGTMTGAPSGVTATIVGSTSGGTSEIVKVVSADDVERAKGQLQGQTSDDEKTALSKKFTNGEIIVDGSFTAVQGTITSTPAVGQPAPDGKATLVAPTTYTIQAVKKDELDKYLKDYLNDNLEDSANQKVYSTGIDDATLAGFKQDDTGMFANVNATGSVGPKIDETAIKTQVAGKKYGEVQATLQSVEGIKDVDVQFSYFWVRTVPNNLDKITIEFKVDDGE